MLFIILPVHNRAQVTEGFLRALAQQTYSDYILVLVDDGCTDETVHIVRSRVATSRLMILSGDGNLWWAGALQLAYERLRGLMNIESDAVLLINDDVGFGPDFLAAGIDLLDEHRAACIQAMAIDAETRRSLGGLVIDRRTLDLRAAASHESPNCLATRGLLMAASTFIASGGFRPRWLPHYLSDYEFTIRLHDQGVLLMCDDRFLLEFDGSTTGDGPPEAAGVNAFWTSALSNRAKLNPKHWTAFAILVCPPGSAVRVIARVWWSFARGLFRSAIGRSCESHNLRA